MTARKRVTITVRGDALSVVGLPFDEASSFVTMIAARATKEPRPSVYRVADFAEYICNSHGFTVLSGGES